MSNPFSKKNCINKLFEIGAIKINEKQPFILASGYESPIYIDNRIIASFVEVRNIIYEALIDLIKQKYPQVDYIVGIATGGIIPAAFVANKLNIGVGYIRSSNKDHGLKKLLEGDINNKFNIVIIEDLITTGKSLVKSYEILKESGVKILGAAVIYNYDLLTNHFIKNPELRIYSLLNFKNILNLFKNEPKTKKILINFYKNLKKGLEIK